MNNKGYNDNNKLSLFEDGNIVKDEIEVSGILNDFYINIVRHITDKDRDGLNLNDLADFREKYSSHPNIPSTKNMLNDSLSFSFRQTTTAKIVQIIKAFDIKSATGTDSIRSKLVITSFNVIAESLTKLVNASAIQSSIFPSCKE